MDYLSTEICNPVAFFTNEPHNSICHLMDNNIDYYRKKAGLTVQALAEKLGITREYLQELKAGRKPGGFTVALLEEMGSHLGCTAAQLISKPKKINITGVIKSGGIVELLRAEDITSIDLPPEGVGKPINCAYKFLDNSNAPMAYKDWLYYIGERRLGGCEDYSDRYYAIKITDSEILIRRIRPARTKGKYSLLGIADFIDDVDIEWCAPILLIEPA